MKFKVVILESAQNDLKELKCYIAKNFSPEVWQTIYKALMVAIQSLKTFPQAGVIPDELASLHLNQYRQVVVGMNRIIYELRHDGIYIHMFADTRRDMKSYLVRRLLRIV